MHPHCHYNRLCVVNVKNNDDQLVVRVSCRNECVIFQINFSTLTREYTINARASHARGRYNNTYIFLNLRNNSERFIETFQARRLLTIFLDLVYTFVHYDRKFRRITRGCHDVNFISQTTYHIYSICSANLCLRFKRDVPRLLDDISYHSLDPENSSLHRDELFYSRKPPPPPPRPPPSRDISKLVKLYQYWASFCLFYRE